MYTTTSSSTPQFTWTIPDPSPGLNGSDPAAGQCWNEWVHYWGYSWQDCSTTFTGTYDPGQMNTLEPVATTTATSTLTTVVDVPGGTIPVATFVLTSTYTKTSYTVIDYTLGPTLGTWTDPVDCPATAPQPTRPACFFEGTYSSCDSQWASWATAYYEQRLNPSPGHPTTSYNFQDEPQCLWASMNSQDCSTLISASYYNGMSIDAYQYLQPGSSEWEPHQIIAPGCTLGCQDCHITGDVVQLLYWPPATATHNTTLAADKTRQVVAYIDGSTLTSPTIYISYKTLHASNSCSGIGPVQSNTIVPLVGEDLSSLVYQPLPGLQPITDIRSLPEPRWTFATTSFNLNDLMEPVPKSIYQKLPWCQKMIRDASYNGEEPGDCSTNIPYAPQIAIPKELRQLRPEWNSCGVWYGGLFDPPSTLSGATLVASVTTPNSGPVQTTPASPVSTVRAGVPTQTAATRPTNSEAQESAPNSPQKSTTVETGTGNTASISQFSPSTPEATATGVTGAETILTAVQSLLHTQETATVVAGHKTFTIVQPQSGSHDATVIADGSTFRVDPHSLTVIDGQTFSLEDTTPTNNGAALTPGSKTQNAVAGHSPLRITVGGTVITEDTASHLLIGSQTLSPGGSAIVEHGTTFSLASDSAIYVNGKQKWSPTAPVQTAAITTGSLGIGDVIASILGEAQRSSSSQQTNVIFVNGTPLSDADLQLSSTPASDTGSVVASKPLQTEASSSSANQSATMKNDASGAMKPRWYEIMMTMILMIAL